jgi:ABC-2 type transport system ATP-binding protein
VLQVGVMRGADKAAELLQQNSFVESVTANDGFLQVTLKDGIQDFSFIPQQLISAGFHLNLLREEEVNLETAFMRLTKGMVQ